MTEPWLLDHYIGHEHIINKSMESHAVTDCEEEEEEEEEVKKETKKLKRRRKGKRRRI